MKTTNFLIYLSMILLIGFQSFAYAQDTPMNHEAKPEIQKETEQQSEINIDDFTNAVAQYIEEETKNGDGFFVVNDPNYDAPVQCSLIKIHKDKLFNVGNNEYFVCVDFKADNGKEYDLDIFMQGNSKDDLKHTRTLVHKEDGVARYNWIEEDGFWKMGEASNEKVQEQPVEDESSVK